MQEVRVLVHFGAPIERVFDAVSDHESFLRDKRTTTRIVRPGAVDRNGLGCMREVKVGGGGGILEEITAWERPTQFDYRIREAPVPVRHEEGRMRFTANGAGTDVEWTSRFTIPVPLVGGLLGKVAGGVFSKAFRGLLTAARAKLEKE
jgi:hypothetical protein